MAKLFSKKLLSVGTIGGAVYSSIHSHTVDHALNEFHGNFICGNVLMNMNSPEYLLQKTDKAKAELEKLAKDHKKKYVVTPRFAITTDPDLMTFGGRIAKKYKSFIQTHLSETEEEIKTVLDIYKGIKGFEEVKNYTEVYHRCGLVNERSIFGHGIHLSNGELKLLSEKGASVAHCPTSNAPHSELGLESGLFDFKKAEKYKVNWGLASDIGGGPYLSMFDVMLSFVLQNRRKGLKEATFTKALYRSTLKNTEILKLKDKGSLDIGKSADFIVVKADSSVLKNKSVESLLEALLMNYQSKRSKFLGIVKETWINGKKF